MIAILSIGSEILDGRVRDTNSQYIAIELNNRGLPLGAIHTCDDILEDIVNELNYLSLKVSYIIVTGGLGPTTDDITRDGIAKFLDVPLISDEDAILRLKKKFEERKRTWNPENLRQTSFPEGYTIIPNPNGTAEGFIVSNDRVTIFSLPGVPRELYPMIEKVVLPFIQDKNPEAKPLARKGFRIFGLPESEVGKKIRELGLPTELFVSYRASFPEIHVVLKSKERALVEKHYPEVQEVVGKEYIFTEDMERSLPQVVATMLMQKGITLSIAESCTGGMMSSLLTDMPGISSVFLGSVISYVNSAKEQILGVPHDIIGSHGAVSRACAKAMAEGVRTKFQSDLALSITGIAGPDGGTEEKPVGTFCIGLADTSEVIAQEFFLHSDRPSIRKFAVWTAFDILRRYMLRM